MAENDLPGNLAFENIQWVQAREIMEAENAYEVMLAERRRRRANPSHANPTSCANSTSCEISKGSLASEIAYARQQILNSLKSEDAHKVSSDSSALVNKFLKLEKENKEWYKQFYALHSKFDELLSRVANVESKVSKLTNQMTSILKEEENGPISENDDDGIDLFSSDEENEDAKIKEERIQAYAVKKAKKPAVIAKSSIILDVKPWSDETDMKEMEIAVRKIETDGLKWGASKLVPMAFGIHKLQIIATVEDDKVSVDWIQETIQEIEDLVQSCDIAAFNKL